jgi:hypothetical protein
LRTNVNADVHKPVANVAEHINVAAVSAVRLLGQRVEEGHGARAQTREIEGLGVADHGSRTVKLALGLPAQERGGGRNKGRRRRGKEEKKARKKGRDGKIKKIEKIRRRKNCCFLARPCA